MYQLERKYDLYGEALYRRAYQTFAAMAFQSGIPWVRRYSSSMDSKSMRSA